MVANKTPKANPKQSNKNRSLLTQEINMEFDATGSPLPSSSVTHNHSSCVTQQEDHDAIEQQNRDKLQKPIKIQPL